MRASSTCFAFHQSSSATCRLPIWLPISLVFLYLYKGDTRSTTYSCRKDEPVREADPSTRFGVGPEADRQREDDAGELSDGDNAEPVPRAAQAWLTVDSRSVSHC